MKNGALLSSINEMKILVNSQSKDEFISVISEIKNHSYEEELDKLDNLAKHIYNNFRIVEVRYSCVLMSSTFPEKLEAGTLYLTVDGTAKKITVQSTHLKLPKELNESEYKPIYEALKIKEDKYETSIPLPKIIHTPDLVDKITSLCSCTLEISDLNQLKVVETEYETLKNYFTSQINRQINNRSDRIIELQRNIYNSFALMKDIISLIFLKCQLKACRLKIVGLEQKLGETFYSKWSNNPLVTSAYDLMFTTPVVRKISIKLGWLMATGFSLLKYCSKNDIENKLVNNKPSDNSIVRHHFLIHAAFLSAYIGKTLIMSNYQKINTLISIARKEESSLQETLRLAENRSGSFKSDSFEGDCLRTINSKST